LAVTRHMLHRQMLCLFYPGESPNRMTLLSEKGIIR